MTVFTTPCIARMTLITALGVARLCGASDSQPLAESAKVFGTGNSQFAAGSLALQQGHAADGIRLTLAGLKDAKDPLETAAAHANLCGGYAMLHQWTQALDHCNSAIALDPTNWHSFNNRAAVFAGRGDYARALADLRSGLELAPQSSTLLRSLSVVEHNRQVLNKRRGAPLRS